MTRASSVSITAAASAVITARCREAFDALQDKMRSIKARYFFSPPMTDSDFALLLLKKPDGTATEVPEPTSQPTADLSFPGVHLVELSKIRPVDETASTKEGAFGPILTAIIP
jgi:hypothetical protein